MDEGYYELLFAESQVQSERSLGMKVDGSKSGRF